MKISIQKSPDKDAVGLFNALSNRRHQTHWWDSEKEDIRDFKPDIIFFTETSKLGTKNIAAVRDAVNVFLKCEVPENCKAEKKFAFESFPILADTVLFPIMHYCKEYAVDVFYLSNFPLEKESEAQTINMIDPISNNFTWRTAGNAPLAHVSYIGHVMTPEDASKLCKSASICIDFGFKQAVNLMKLGCRVITDMENTWDLPVFTPATINQVIAETLAKPKPVLNKYEDKIMSYTQFCGQLSQLIGVTL